MSYDEKCYELAEHFLPNPEKGQLENLAQHIQYSIEDWLMGSENWGPEGMRRLADAVTKRGTPQEKP